MMTPDFEKLPPRTIVPSGSTLSRIDIGLAVASVARTCWKEIEKRAGLMIVIDAWGPVMGAEPLVEKLLRDMVLELLRSIPDGARNDHVIGLSTRVGKEDTLVVVVRHVQKRGVRAESLLEGARAVAAWDREAIQFAGRVQLVTDPLAERCYRLTLHLANTPAQRS